MHKYQLIALRNDDRTALAKAPADVAVIAERMGFEKIALRSFTPHSTNLFERAVKLIRWEIEWRRVVSLIRLPAVLLIQGQPAFLCRRAARHFVDALQKNEVKIITLYHDLGELRQEHDVSFYHAQTLATIDYSSALIAHNAVMKAKLVEYGAKPECVTELGIFDYCYEGAPASVRDFRKGEVPDVVIAGNMSVLKSAYMGKLGRVANVHWRLYGPNFSFSDPGQENIAYCGCYPSDELPAHLEGHFGLVWDGNSVETCSGATGEYLRYNNPHKLSLYLVAGLPVIIWSQSAEAQLVLREGVGFTIDSLSDIPTVVATLTSGEYARMVDNAREFGARLRRGEFTEVALECSMERMEVGCA